MKQSFYAKTQANKSLDVRAKQRLCFNGSSFILTCVWLVSPHVNSIVGHLLFNSKRMNWYQTKISSEELFYHGKLQQLKDEFWRLLESYAQKNDVLPEQIHLFISDNVSEEIATIYFSPECVKYCPELLTGYSASICSRPSRNSVKPLAGEGVPDSFFQ